MSEYKYQGAPEQRVFGALPAGDYAFVIAEVIREPYRASSGNLVLSLKLTILPDGVPVFWNGWCGTDKNGDERDGIAEVLLAVNRVPKIGTEPDWQRLVGAKGKCRLKVEVAQQGSLAGKEVSKVHYFYIPKQVGPTAAQAPQTYSNEEFNKAAKQQAARSAGPAASDLAVEPDDIPF
jgi:hypothetical protein